MDFAKLLAFLETTDEGKTFKSEIVTHIETTDKMKGDLDDEKAKTSSIGDRDIGRMISTHDWLKENGLDTAEKLSEYKAKSDGLENTVEQQKEASAKLAEELELRSTKIKDEADYLKLEANVQVALSDKVGDRGGFNLLIKDKMSKNMFSTDESGNILYGVEGQRKSLEDSVEELRNESPYAFAPKPDGTGNPSKPNQQQQSNKYATNDDTRARLNKMFQ
jgi:hypothetical protein